MASDTTDLVLRLIETQRTLGLATADPEPWSAPVYYVYQKGRFCFFSSVESRHVTAALASERCAGAIYRDSDDWREIEGVQMEGKVERIPVGVEAVAVLQAYVGKYPTVKDFFVDAVFDFEQFTARFRTQLYAFVPERVFYLNNQAGFGKREEIRLMS